MIELQRRHLRLAVVAACALAAAISAVMLIEYFGSASLSDRVLSEGGEPRPAAAPSISLAKMSLHDAPRLMPDLRFEDDSGQLLALASFAGRVVLLNIWATWCIPCREEMPTLDRLQAQLGSPAFHVVALSIDRAGVDSVRQFYGEIGIKNLAIYIDSSGQAASALGVVGLPTTLLIDRQGREIGRLVGPAEWDAPEMVAFFRNRLAERTGVAIPAQWRQAAMHSRAETALAFHLSLATTVLPSTTAKETRS